MQRALLNLAIGIVACLEASGCSGRSSPNGTATTRRELHESPEDRSKPIADDWDFPVFNNWSPKRIFADPKVVELCYAIADQDYALVERLVKNEGVDINAKGFMDITPLLWAFPLGRLESVHCWHSQGLRPDNDARRAEVREIEQKVLAKHASFLEKLLRLGADPNVITQEADRKDILGNHKVVAVPGDMFPPKKGFSVSHLAAKRYGPAEFSYLASVMTNGGDPNLTDETRDATPTAIVCGGDDAILGSLRSPPQDLAIMIEARADLELRDRQGNTPILLAARVSRYSMVYMLIHAGADFRAKNDKGEDLAWHVRRRQRIVEKTPAPRPEVDPYFREVANFLEHEGLLPEGTHDKWKYEFDRLTEEHGKRRYADRDPFVEEWVAKRRRLEASSERDGETPKAKAAREGE